MPTLYSRNYKNRTSLGIITKKYEQKIIVKNYKQIHIK